MHCTHDPGTANRMEGSHAANRLFVPEPTARYNAGIQYSRLIHRRCASLDLETAFKELKISQNIEKEVCAQCQAEICRCPAFTPGTPCSSASSTPTNISDEQIPDFGGKQTVASTASSRAVNFRRKSRLRSCSDL